MPFIWSEWKSYTQEPEFCAQYVQVRLNDENISKVKVTADIEDIEDTVTNIDIPAQTTTISLNKNFTLPPVVIPTTVDETCKVCVKPNRQFEYFGIFSKNSLNVISQFYQASKFKQKN